MQCLEQDGDIVISSYCVFIIMQCYKISKCLKGLERKKLRQRARFIVASHQVILFFFIILSSHSTICYKMWIITVLSWEGAGVGR